MNYNSQETPNFYAILPANIRYSKDLTDFQKILYSEISALTQANGYCYAKNSYFSKVFNKDIATISRHISKLVKLGFLSIEFKYKSNTKEIENRFLRVIPIDKNINTPCQNNQDPIDKNIKGGIDENVKDNNTSKEQYKNNKKNKIKKDNVSDVKKSKKVDYISIIDNSVLSVSVKSELKIFFDNRKELAQSDRKFKITTIAVQRIIQNLLSSKFNDDKHRIESISNAIQSNYVTIYPVKNFNQKNSNDNFRDFISEQKQNLQKQNQIINHSLPTLPNNEIDENLILDRFEKQPF